LKLKQLLFITFLLSFCVCGINAQEKGAILDLVERAVTSCDLSLIPKSAARRPDKAIKTGRFEWTKNETTLSVDITAFPWIEAAVKEFGKPKSYRKEPKVNISEIPNIGEFATLLTLMTTHIWP